MTSPPAVTSRLLLSGQPLVIIPALAVAVGLNEAVFLQQLHYWLQLGDERGDIGVVHNGRRWIYNTIPAWCRQFPYVSARTLQRVIGKLSQHGLVITDTLARIPEIARQTGRDPRDRISFYTIDYQRLAVVAGDSDASPDNSTSTIAPCQIDTLQGASQTSCSAPHRHVIYRTEITPDITQKQHLDSPALTEATVSNAAAPPAKCKGHKRERTHPQTDLVYWYDDEPDDIARDVKDFGLDAVRAMAATFRHAGKVPLRGRVAEALRAERGSELVEAQKEADRERALQEQNERAKRDGDPVNQAAGAKARADLMRKFGIKVKS